MEIVKLIGTPFSFFTYRVIWALKLKGINYEYIDEDMSKKSSLLVKYNPIHKKVPVLIHGDKIICESMVIVEYIDETWQLNPLLSTDSYERATSRFWAKYIEEKVWCYYDQYFLLWSTTSNSQFSFFQSRSMSSHLFNSLVTRFHNLRIRSEQCLPSEQLPLIP